MDKGSLEKVDIVKESKTTEAILKHVPPENVPKALGGSMPSSEGDDYCSNLIAPGGEIPEDIIAMTFASTTGLRATSLLAFSPRRVRLSGN